MPDWISCLLCRHYLGSSYRLPLTSQATKQRRCVVKERKQASKQASKKERKKERKKENEKKTGDNYIKAIDSMGNAILVTTGKSWDNLPERCWKKREHWEKAGEWYGFE